ncbi:hypothetical protein ABZ511_03115 [Nocardia gamkensis]|uniref:hypothetical protein n=1 Tax=Nocardia gamkensis TaxID=352869 RepID=UPI0033E558EA
MVSAAGHCLCRQISLTRQPSRRFDGTTSLVGWNARASNQSLDIEGTNMSSKMSKFVAATAIALPLATLAAPVASATPLGTAPASSTSTAVVPAGGTGSGWGSVAICFPLGSVVWCI